MKHSFRKYTLALVALLCLLCVVLVGCSLTIEGADGKDGKDGVNGTNGIDGINGTDGLNGVDGKDGAKWYSGIDIPTIQAVDGDFYIDTDDYILYQMKDGIWSVLIENFGKPGADGQDGKDGIDGIDGKDGINGVDGKDGIDGQNGKDGVDGKDGIDGTNGKDGVDGKDGIDGINGVDGTNGINGSNGTNGSDGKDGTNIYIGYDGYIWQDDFRTDFKLDRDNTGNENVVENTIGAYTTMKYFEGSFIDLSSKQIALMANYKPNAKITQYSATKVSEIQIVSENAGTLHIGTAKVGDIVNARANGTAYTADTTSYDVNSGINTISLNLTVGDDETVVIGGANSTAKIYVVCIPVIDEVGNFSILDGIGHDDLICKTNGYPDTIAIRVRAESVSAEGIAVFSQMTTQFPTSSFSSFGNVVSSAAPFRYTNNYASGKTVTKIGVPVGAISEGENYITVYKIKNSVTSNFVENAIGSPIKLTFDNAIVGEWAYAQCDITLADDETLAFGAKSGDTLTWMYAKSNSSYSDYFFYTNSGGLCKEGLLFDIYVKNDALWDEHIKGLESKEDEAIDNLKPICSKISSRASSCLCWGIA